jgi:hypothetical protein
VFEFLKKGSFVQQLQNLRRRRSKFEFCSVMVVEKVAFCGGEKLRLVMLMENMKLEGIEEIGLL